MGANAAGARVNWKSVCTLRSEGGLGLKDLISWNVACMVALIRVLLAGQGSLWVAWVNVYVLKGGTFLCGISRDVLTWELELEWAVKYYKGKSLIALILRLAWNAFLYFVWKERNGRIFKSACLDPSSLLHSIEDVVHTRLSGKYIQRSDSIDLQLCCRWGITV
ncbi:hypothetical protein GQ457_09G011660 [Hibiscus cannabinus]